MQGTTSSHAWENLHKNKTEFCLLKLCAIGEKTCLKNLAVILVACMHPYKLNVAGIIVFMLQFSKQNLSVAC